MNDVLFNQVDLVDIDTIKTYEKNPRKGNVRAIAESLATNKQYRPIVVQKKGRKILAGNHTHQAAKSLGWQQIAVVFVDVDDKQARRIVLADNRTNDLAEYDNEVLMDLLADLGTPEGTGYSVSDMNAIVQGVMDSADGVLAASDDMAENVLLGNDPMVDTPTPSTATGTSEADEDWETDIENDDQAEGDGVGVYSLKDDMVFNGATYWEIPVLRQDMMIEELPRPLHTWAGSATRDMAWDGHWLYNWGIDSTSGMEDLSKIFLSFYAFDEYFECWWDNAPRYLAKVINAKIKYAITPNFSQEGMPRAQSLNQLYRSRWVGRYLQEVGCQVMPDIECLPEDSFRDIFLKSLPKRVPWAATQVQNLFAETRTGVKATDEDRKEWAGNTAKIVQQANIENLLVYANPNKVDMVNSFLAPLVPDTHLEYMPTRLHYLSAHRKAKQGTANTL